MGKAATVRAGSGRTTVQLACKRPRETTMHPPPLPPPPVILTPDLMAVLTAAALGSGAAEEMAMLTSNGEGGEGESRAIRVTGAVFAPRTTRETARVELDPVALTTSLTSVSSDPSFSLTPVGWWHSHPSLTVAPSALDAATHARHQAQSPSFVGLITAIRGTTLDWGAFSVASPSDLTIVWHEVRVEETPRPQRVPNPLLGLLDLLAAWEEEARVAAVETVARTLNQGGAEEEERAQSTSSPSLAVSLPPYLSLSSLAVRTAVRTSTLLHLQLLTESAHVQLEEALKCSEWGKR